MSDSQTYGLTIKELFIVDSTTIRLFTDILKGVGRNPKNDGKKKGGLKVHMLIDASQSIAKFVKITEAKMHDKQFMKEIQVPAYSMLVFDKAYNFTKKAAVKKAFSTVATLISIHLVSLLDVIDLIQNTKRAWKIQTSKVMATTLFDT